MGPSWTAAPSRSTSLARAKSVRAEAAVVANLAAVVAVAAVATRKSARFYPARFGGNPASLFCRPLVVETPEPRENIEHPTSNTERRSERGFALPFAVRRWMFDVGCSSGFMGQGGSSEILQSGLDRVVVPKMRPARTA